MAKSDDMTPEKSRLDMLLLDATAALEGKDIDAAAAAAEDALAIAEGLGADHCSDLAACLCVRAKVHEHRPDEEDRAEELLLRGGPDRAASRRRAPLRRRAPVRLGRPALQPGRLRGRETGDRAPGRREPGPEHAGIAVNAAVIVRRCVRAKDLEIAQALGERTLEISEAAFGDGHPLAKLAMMSLCEVYVRQGDLSRSDRLLLRVMRFGQTPHESGDSEIAGAGDLLSDASAPQPDGPVPPAARRSRRKKKR